MRDLEAEIRREKDPKRLREMAVLALQTNAKLSRELVQLKIENAKLRGEDFATLELELRFTNEQLAARNRPLFGPSSERRGSGASEVSEKRPKFPGHGPTTQPALPRMEQGHVLEEPDRTCPQCGGQLEEMSGQFEESEEIDFALAVALGKYAYHLPLARQVKQMRRGGLEITSQTLWDQP